MKISLQNLIKQNTVFFFCFFFFKLKKKNENFQFNSFDIFLFVQNIDCGHKIERILTIKILIVSTYRSEYLSWRCGT